MKTATRICKKAVSKFRLLNRLRKRAPFILMYHGVVAPERESSDITGKFVPVAEFRRQVDYLKEAHEVVAISALVDRLDNGGITGNEAVITFDDGYRNNYLHAFPVLREAGVPATVFLATGFISGKKWLWVDRVEYAVNNSLEIRSERLGLELKAADLDGKRRALVEIKKRLKALPSSEIPSAVEEIGACVKFPDAPCGNYEFMGWDDIREMSGSGVEFGPHTVNHPILTRISFEDAKREITESKAEIEAETGRCADVFCYPNGKRADYDERIKGFLKGLFRCALSAEPGHVGEKSDLFELRRIPVDRMDFSDFYWSINFRD